MFSAMTNTHGWLALRGRGHRMTSGPQQSQHKLSQPVTTVTPQPVNHQTILSIMGGKMGAGRYMQQEGDQELAPGVTTVVGQ